MGVMDKYGQSPRSRRNPYSGRRENAGSPVVRTSNNAAKPSPFVDPHISRRSQSAPVLRRPPAPSTIEKSAPAPEKQVPVQEPQSQARPKPILSMDMVFASLWHYRGLAAVIILLFTFVGIVGMTMLPKKYSAEISIYFDPHAIELAQTNPQAPPMSPESISATIESQTQILTSRVILKRVALKLGLNRDPEFVAADDQAAGPDDVPYSVIEKLMTAAKSKREQNSYVVTLAITTKSATKSADIANTIVEEFIAEEQSSLNGLYTNANSNLGNRVVELAEVVRKADQAVEDYKSKNDLVTADGNLISDKRLISLNESLLAAQNRTIQAKARVDFVASLGLEANGNEKDTTESTSNELSNLRRQYSEQAAKVGSLQSQLGSRHPILLAAQASLNDIAKLVKSEQDRILTKAKAQLQQAQQAENDISKQLTLQKALQSGSADRLVGLKELQRLADAVRAQYDAVVKRANDTGEKTNSTYNNIRVISDAAAPAKADGPAKSVMMIAGAFGGLMLGLALATVLSLLLTFRSTSQNKPPSQQHFV